MGVFDLRAFLSGGSNTGMNLDKATAQTLGISVIHAILLRRFNDLSSLSPAIVLNEPERILGKNWERVLEFWHYIESLNLDDLNSLLTSHPLTRLTPSDETEEREIWLEWKSQKSGLKRRTKSLDLIVPDLHYPLRIDKPLDSSSVTRISVEEAEKTYPSLTILQTDNQSRPHYLNVNQPKPVVVGDYSRGYFGWIAPYDYFLSNVSTVIASGGSLAKLQVLFACATNEIQVLGDDSDIKDLYFCNIIGYNPFENRTLKKMSRKIKEYKKSLFEGLVRFYRTTDNLLFNRFSKNKPKDELTIHVGERAVNGDLRLTVEDIVNGSAYDKICRTVVYTTDRGMSFNYLTILVPKLGEDDNANTQFNRLLNKLHPDYNVWPVSFCEIETETIDEGSKWGITAKQVTSDVWKRKVNVPQGSPQTLET